MLNAIYQSIDPIAVALGPLEIRWYGIAYILGFLIAAFIIYKVAKSWELRISSDDVLSIMLCGIIGIIVGARLGYCIVYGNGYYLTHPLEVFAFNQGGMSFHGGLVGALIGGILAAKITHIPYLTLTDIGFIAAPLGLFFGRCANFINGELWGAPTDLPIGVVFGGEAGNIARHPSQLYEAVLEGLVIFLILILMSRKKPPFPRGVYSGTFLVLYGVFRFLIEFIREPDANIGYLFGDWLTMGMVLSIPLAILGAALLVYAFYTNRPQCGDDRLNDQYLLHDVDNGN